MIQGSVNDCMWQCTAFISGIPAERILPARQSLHLSATLRGASTSHHPRLELVPMLVRLVQANSNSAGGSYIYKQLLRQPGGRNGASLALLHLAWLSTSICSHSANVCLEISDFAKQRKSTLSSLYDFIYFSPNRNFCSDKHLLQGSYRYVVLSNNTAGSEGQVWQLQSVTWSTAESRKFE